MVYYPWNYEAKKHQMDLKLGETPVSGFEYLVERKLQILVFIRDWKTPHLLTNFVIYSLMVRNNKPPFLMHFSIV